MIADDLDRLPFPLAGTWRLLRNETQPANTIYRMFDVLEVGLRYLCACVACERRAAGDGEAVAAWTGKPKTLGAMVAWLRDSLKGGNHGPFAGRLAKVWSQAEPHVDRLVSERNRTRGHGLTVSDRRYRKLQGELEPHLSGFLDLFRHLEGFRPVIVKGMNDFDGTWYEHQVLIALGDNPYFPVETLRSESSLAFRRVFLRSEDGSLVSLHPFLVYELCPEHDEEHLFLFQRAERNRMHCVEPLRGCEIDAPLAGERPSGSGRGGPVQTIAQSSEEERIVAPGLELAGRYRLGKEIGRGAGGRVFRAHDQISDAEVAVKVFDPP
ncbi:MAG: hypothetical protein ACJ76J_26200, partial [Thermoanaerobaculia bacterium]